MGVTPQRLILIDPMQSSSRLGVTGAAHTRVVPNSQILGLKRPIFFFLLCTMCIGLWFTPQAPHGPALAASPQKPNAMRSIYVFFESQPQRMLAQTPGPLCPERNKPLSPGAGWRAWNRIFCNADVAPCANPQHHPWDHALVQRPAKGFAHPAPVTIPLRRAKQGALEVKVGLHQGNTC